MPDSIRFLGLIKAAGKLVTGEDTVRNTARDGKVKLVLLTQDAGSSAVHRGRQAGALCGVPVVTLPCSKRELGAALGLDVVSVAAVTDSGFVKSLLQKIQKDTGSAVQP